MIDVNEGFPCLILMGYFKQHSGAEEAVLAKIYGAFKKLCTLGDFSDGGETAQDDKKGHYVQPMDNLPQFSLPIPITMNIQIVIPNDATEEQYDKIFSSIRKFLTSSQQDEK
jgi:hypothetical protein